MWDRSTPLTAADAASLDWDKMEGLVPAMIQDAASREVLMLGYMDQEALRITLEEGQATFFSRSRQSLWRKGETSGNRLLVEAIFTDCDRDSLLILARPLGPACHLGTSSCFGDGATTSPIWLSQLSAIVRERRSAPEAESYTARLIGEGVLRIAQKVGEEGVELALAAAAGTNEDVVEEAADLLFHLTVLMEERGIDWAAIIGRLQARHAGQVTPGG